MDWSTTLAQMSTAECKILLTAATIESSLFTRNDIADAANVSRPTTGKALARLVERGLLNRPNHRQWTINDGWQQPSLFSAPAVIDGDFAIPDQNLIVDNVAVESEDSLLSTGATVDKPVQSESLLLSPALPVDNSGEGKNSCLSTEKLVDNGLIIVDSPAESQNLSSSAAWAAAIVDKSVRCTQDVDNPFAFELSTTESKVFLPSDAPAHMRTPDESKEFSLSDNNLSTVSPADSTRIDDDNELITIGEGLKYLPSSFILDRLLIGGEHYHQIAQMHPDAVLGAYFYVRTWANEPTKGLIAHLKGGNRSRNKTPLAYINMVEWYTAAHPDEKEHLQDAILDYCDAPKGVSDAMLDAARAISRTGGWHLSA